MKTLHLLTIAIAGILHLYLTPLAAGAPGDVDLSFDPGSGVNGPVNGVAVQQDGKTLIRGSFTTVKGLARTNLARLNADGSGDASFNPPSGIAGAEVTAFTLLADGKLLAGYNFPGAASGMVRLHPDGSMDPTFTSGVGSGFPAHIAVQANGSILVVGNFSLNGSSYGISRLHSDGSLDSTFTPVAGASEVNSVVFQADGKMLIAGSYSFFVNGTLCPGIARLNVNGSLDGTFTPIQIAYRKVVIALQPDGKILVGGSFSVNGLEYRLARFHANGSRDPSFSLGIFADIDSCLVQTDGKILIRGGFHVNGIYSNVGRLLANGALDTSFPGASANYIESLALQPDGKVLLAGGFTSLNTYWANGPGRNGIARLNADGTPDYGFDPGTSNVKESVSDIALQSDGKVLIAGLSTIIVGDNQYGEIRLHPDGSPDGSFTPNHFGPAGPAGGITAAAVRADGSVLAASYTLQYECNDPDAPYEPGLCHVVGSTHTLAGGPGFASDYMGFIHALLFQPDGKVLVGGYGLTRLNADGSPDPTFTVTGLDARAIALQPDGKILVGGTFTSVNGTTRNRIARLHPDGSTDLSFDPGAGASGATEGETGVYAIAVQSDGKVIVGGTFTTFNGVTRTRVARLNANGSLDGGFDPGSGANGVVRSIAMQPDGNILIAGDFTVFDGVPRPYIARLFGGTSAPNSYASWAASAGLLGGDADDDADPDRDGLPNAVEYIVGGIPSQSSSLMSPSANLVGQTLKFSFLRDDASETSDVSLAVESGTDLVTWPTVFNIGPTTAASSPGVSLIENGSAPDTISVAIPLGTDKAKFARLKVTVAP